MRREMRVRERTHAAERRRVKQFVMWGSLTVIAAGVIIAAVAFARQRTANLPGTFIANVQGRDHIALDAPHVPYDTNPPTAGPHYQNPVKAGIYDEPVADEYLVHNMEHGHVIVWYNCARQATGLFGIPAAYADHAAAHTPPPGALPSGMAPAAPAATGAPGIGERLREGCPDAIEKLKAMLKDDYDMWKVVLVPRGQLDTRFALTAWERIDKFNDFDEARIRRFIDRYRNRGPEATSE